MVGYYFVAALCGVAVACAEVVSRYKDDPVKAICCRWGAGYLFFNGLLPVAGFAILVAAGTASATTSDIDNLKYALYVGFGAMVIIRSKLFNLKLEGGDKLSIGPDFVIDTFLSAMDRQIDRQRAYERARIVKEVMEGIDFGKVRMPIVTLMTRSMQGITESEMKELGIKVKETEQAQELSNQEKSYALGFMVLDLAGEDFFRKVFDKRERLKYKVAQDAGPGGPAN